MNPVARSDRTHNRAGQPLVPPLTERHHRTHRQQPAPPIRRAWSVRLVNARARLAASDQFAPPGVAVPQSAPTPADHSPPLPGDGASSVRPPGQPSNHIRRGHRGPNGGLRTCPIRDNDRTRCSPGSRKLRPVCRLGIRGSTDPGVLRPHSTKIARSAKEPSALLGRLVQVELIGSSPRDADKPHGRSPPGSRPKKQPPNRSRRGGPRNSHRVMSRIDGCHVAP